GLIFNRDLLIELLQRIDKELEASAKLYIIGGSAACLAYDSKLGTKDIDTWEKEQNIENAYKKVIKKFPHLKIPLNPACVNINSPEMQNRFLPYEITGLKNLKVFVPEPEDLFLLKAQRADEKDLEDLAQLASQQKLNEKTLLQRFSQELLPLYFGDNEVLKNNYLICIEEIFGEVIADKHFKKLKS